MGDRDLLYALRNNFHLGAYQAAIGEANDLQHDDLGERENVERDIFMYRAYIEMGKPEEALSGINDDAPLALQAVKGLARLRTDPDANRLLWTEDDGAPLEHVLRQRRRTHADGRVALKLSEVPDQPLLVQPTVPPVMMWRWRAVR